MDTWGKGVYPERTKGGNRIYGIQARGYFRIKDKMMIRRVLPGRQALMQEGRSSHRARKKKGQKNYLARGKEVGGQYGF